MTDFTPIVIIGAGRSGTNMLRDLLTQLDGFGTWPCDEINYIWRHGNLTHPNDEFTAEQARPEVKRFIQHKFQLLARQYQLQHVVEKTCANSLRVRFVNEIVPDARYLFIVRDGRDVVASALKRWSAPLDPTYIAAKARYVPPTDIPYYGARYLGNRIYQVFSKEKRLAFWGPRFAGMEGLLRTESLPVVCAHQWRRCVERAAEDFQAIAPSRVFSLQYEQLVSEPVKTLEAVLDFLQVEVKASTLAELTRTIVPNSVGKWRSDLTDEVVNEIEPIIQPLQVEYGYAEQRQSFILNQ
jgi:hypothetical protein